VADLAIVAVVAFLAGFGLALHLVGYGVRGGLQQCVRLWRYRRGRCSCSICREARS
jgi:hypothetical protein